MVGTAKRGITGLPDAIFFIPKNTAFGIFLKASETIGIVMEIRYFKSHLGHFMEIWYM
jgi:hypothetical protein